MCLRQAIRGACAAAAATLVVDLRDLTAIDAAGLTMFVRATARSRGRGVQLALLVWGDAHHDAIVDAFNPAGLAEQLLFTCERSAAHDPERAAPDALRSLPASTLHA